MLEYRDQGKLILDLRYLTTSLKVGRLLFTARSALTCYNNLQQLDYQQCNVQSSATIRNGPSGFSLPLVPSHFRKGACSTKQSNTCLSRSSVARYPSHLSGNRQIPWRSFEFLLILAEGSWTAIKIWGGEEKRTSRADRVVSSAAGSSFTTVNLIFTLLAALTAFVL